MAQNTLHSIPNSFRCVCLPGKQDELHTMISRYFKKVTYEAFNGIVIPINTGNGKHWSIIFINCGNQTLYFYDPMHSGIKNTTVVHLIKQYFAELNSFRSCSMKFNGKRLVAPQLNRHCLLGRLFSYTRRLCQLCILKLSVPV